MSIESSQPYDPDERRRDAEMDGSGISNYLANEHHPEPIESLVEITGPSAASKKTIRKRSNRRGGRSYPDEITGQDISRELANKDALEHPMTIEERRAATERGRAMIRTFRGKLEIDRIIRQEQEKTVRDEYNPERAKAGEDRAITARLRARQERLLNE